MRAVKHTMADKDLDKQKLPDNKRTTDGRITDNEDASHNLYEARVGGIGARVEHVRQEAILEADRE